jgi:bifunctional DNase/RNase
MRRPLCVLSAVMAGLLGCQPDPLEAEAGGLRDAAAALEPTERPGSSPTSKDATPASPEVPEGYVVMKPILRTGSFGHAVLLLDAANEKFVPIFIGGTEALSIQLRLDGKIFKRPLTHDLFDAFSKEMGARLVRSQVDRIVDGVYIGTVVFERKRPGEEPELFSLDARTSDAIALAIGNGVPIYVADAVLEEAGIAAEELGDEGAPTDAAPKNPIAL